MMMPKVIQRGLLVPFLALNVCFKLHLKELNKKLDSVLENSNAFSSTKWETLLTTHRATVEMLTLTNAHVLEQTTKTAQASEKKIIESTEKVNNLIKEFQQFMSAFRTSSDKNTADMNMVIESF